MMMFRIVLGFGLRFSVLIALILGFLFEASFDLNFLNIFLLLIFSMGCGGTLSSLLLYMLPGKRAVAVEVIDGHHSETTVLKKRRSDCLITGAASTTDNNNSGCSSSNNNNFNSSNNSHSGSDIVGPPNMAMDDGNPPDIDEDLHSRQLAVYGRETMRRLFGSNILISGLQGLGAEIGAFMIIYLLLRLILALMMANLCV